VTPARKRGIMITRRLMLAATSGLAALELTRTIAAPDKLLAQAEAENRFATRPRQEAMKITRSQSQPSRKGPAEYFTGSVRIDSPFQGNDPARVGGAFVTFEPGARTAWHTHPLGQTLIVVFGCGWVRVEGGPKEEIRPGDIVWIPAGEKHWHGATADNGMTHIAIAEALDGKTVDWMEQVSEEQYRS
jgi:quercetin dioxygenase-like cupin family protein